MLSGKRKLGILVLCLVLTACDGLVGGFKAGLAASKPFVQSLVDSGAIPQTAANLAIADLTEGANDLTTAQQCLDQAKPLAGGAKRVAKAKCYYSAAQSLRQILARHNFDANAKLTRISTIVAGAIEAFEAYYTTVTTSTEAVGPTGGITSTGADGISGENADKELEARLKEAKRQLEELTKGQ